MSRIVFFSAVAFLTASFAFAAPKGVTSPTAITVAADAPAPSYLVFRGEIATGGGEAAMWFEYGMSESLGQKTTEERLRVSTTTTPVSSGVSVEGGRVYYYRVVVKNEVETVAGEVMQITSTSPPSLTVMPKTATMRMGSRKEFRALYDADGAGSGGTEDVTERTTWLSESMQVASHEIGGRYFARAVGKTIVRALYNPYGPVMSLSDVRNIPGNAELTVEAVPLNSTDIDTDDDGGLGNLPFAILIGILATLVFAAVGITVWHFTKRFRQ